MKHLAGVVFIILGIATLGITPWGEVLHTAGALGAVLIGLCGTALVVIGADLSVDWDKSQ